MKHTLGGVLLSAVLVTAGCGESHSTEEDAGITFDATLPPDTGPVMQDAGNPPVEGDIGEPCGSMSDCESYCITEADGFPGGYCTAACDADNPCPSGSTCTPVGMGSSICLADCDPTSTDRTCRMGYGCAESFMLPGPVCVPGCQDDTDCPGDTACDPDSGFAGSCYDPSARFGDACMDESECPAGSFCLEERFAGWPGGACIGFGCDVEAGTGCPEGTVCLPGGHGGICVASCREDGDCREEYACKTHGEYPGRMYCAPACTDDSQCSGDNVCNPGLGTCDAPFDPDELGQPCSSDRDACEGGTCLTEFESGLPGSYCTYVGCDPDMADGDAGADGCPGDGVCIDVGTIALCLDGCADDADCRAHYACVPSDPADPSSPLACRPACETDDACANDGFVCNQGTGVCRPPVPAGDVGEPCIGNSCGEEICSGGTCVRGGACISEEADGWPAGTCALPGCRLSGEGPAEPCPTGSVCVDDGEGDPTLGVCIDACTVGTTGECRPGYACVELAPGSTDGACGPACDSDDDCGGSRTCDTDTGLCR